MDEIPAEPDSTPHPPSPRPPSPRGPRRRRAALIGAAMVAVMTAAGITYVATRSSAPTSVAAPRTTRVPTTPPPTPPSTSRPPPTSAPAPAPHLTATVAPIPHERVAPAAPTGFAFRAANFTIKAQVCGMPDVRPLDPPGEQHHTVCWVQEHFGVAPGSSSGTTYVLGHSWGQDDREVLNRISEPATREILKVKPRMVAGGVTIWPVHSLVGSSIVLRTSQGVLTYRVREIFGVRKNQAGFVRSLMNERDRNRVVILTCAELKHTDYDYNVVVYAYLHSSVRTTPAV